MNYLVNIHPHPPTHTHTHTHSAINFTYPLYPALHMPRWVTEWHAMMRDDIDRITREASILQHPVPVFVIERDPTSLDMFLRINVEAGDIDEDERRVCAALATRLANWIPQLQIVLTLDHETTWRRVRLRARTAEQAVSESFIRAVSSAHAHSPRIGGSHLVRIVTESLPRQQVFHSVLGASVAAIDPGHAALLRSIRGEEGRVWLPVELGAGAVRAGVQAKVVHKRQIASSAMPFPMEKRRMLQARPTCICCGIAVLQEPCTACGYAESMLGLWECAWK